MNQPIDYDLVIIGGGINGAAIAADAAGRGLSICLCEKNDLGSATSSWSSKLIHGGLRYLEQYDFKLVREALIEREILLKRAPFLIHPLPFILPHIETLRPAWMIRVGLFFYDHLAKHPSLPNSKKVKLTDNILKSQFKTGFSYYDCKTDDSRLVILNALSAKKNGADILTHCQCISAEEKDGHWRVTLEHNDQEKEIGTKLVINATGPWIKDTVTNVLHNTPINKVTLDKGSHIVVPKLYEGDHAYILQNNDERIVFAIPYFNNFTLIGTTEQLYQGNLNNVTVSDDEIKYLCDLINFYFNKQISHTDIVWQFAGVRPLFSSNTANPKAASREFHLALRESKRSHFLSVYGGKLTTHRILGEQAVDMLAPFFKNIKPSWTSQQPLPGGDIQQSSFSDFVDALIQQYHWLEPTIIRRYANSYGTRTHELLNGLNTTDHLGQHFGGSLYEHEVEFLKTQEWAETLEDILWRRSKLGLFMSAEQQAQLGKYLGNQST